MHTPGPWNISKIANNYDQYMIYSETDTRWPTVAHSVEGKDNAHLIAAAPKMLDTLKELQSYLRGFLDPEISVDVGMDTDILNQIAMIDKLIAEAEGKL